MRTSTKIGDITTVQRGVIVQQVNAQGVMGSGVAAAIRVKYPKVFTEYSKIVPTGLIAPESSALLGRCILVEIIPSQLYVFNIVGQQFYGKGNFAGKPLRYTSYDALDVGFQTLRNHYLDLPIHYPLIGAGLGGGQWFVIREIINFWLKDEEHHLWVQPNKLEPV